MIERQKSHVRRNAGAKLDGAAAGSSETSRITQEDEQLMQSQSARDAGIEMPRHTGLVIRRMWRASIGEHWRFGVVLVSICLYTVMSIAGPAYSAYMIDLLWREIQQAFLEGRSFTIGWSTGLREVMVYLCIWTLAWAFYSIQSFTMASFAERLNLKLRHGLAEKLNRLPLGFFDERKPGEIISRATNDLDKVSEVLQRGLLTLLTAVGSVSGALIMMVRYNVLLAGIFVAFAVAAMILTRFISRRTRVLAARQQEAIGTLSSSVEEAYSGRTVLKAFNCEQDSSERIHAATRRVAAIVRKTDFMTNVAAPMVRFLSRIAQVVLAVLGVGMLVRAELTIGTLQAFFYYVNIVSEPLTQFSVTVNTLQSALASVERVFEILDEEEIVPDPALPVSPPSPVTGRIAFEHVRFGYDSSRPLMHDVSFVAEPGQKVAIVGATGAGKTTLINLLMRFYEIDGGRITLDGIDTKSMSREALRLNFGMVLQDAWLREGTIAENIAYGRPDATRDEIVQAAKTAHVDFLVRTMPHGYDTRIDNDAETISQGQRQLITIARVLLANPAILILDEATSSVDTKTEKAIVRAMEQLTCGRTSFVIAHRLSTIVDSDLILVMENGTIVEQGTHDALLRAGGPYADLYMSQFA
ncbi:ABC transporter related protein [Coriobacterium glomerans PW2]|uniref:Fatty acid ABC transporter ATP-binding/permease protein n=1 Tax=Coriobacterium glomerans (strain ATCC 49209 / DSM 20642 / JCM 10262 / PW2) TaxID=700015 RepID=F2NAG2_CORGP|nr:ABC transporter ATP-binding protein [Coriobacterium glomerans]AEB06489.1 ABC transporter related protein [Coriobacterium glomerans PW2]